jgi:hypothetical protein
MVRPKFSDKLGFSGERLTTNISEDSNKNEVYIDRDIMVLANPEIANLPGWVIASSSSWWACCSALHCCGIVVGNLLFNIT